MCQPDMFYILASTAFCCFQFTIDDDLPVLYLYEIHSNIKGVGMGTRLMDLVEAIAKHYNMVKIVLTVFRQNKGAISFYQRRGYQRDCTCPDDECFLILSLEI